MRRLFLCFSIHPLDKCLVPALIFCCVTALAQSNPVQSPDTIAQLSHFDASQVDRTLDPCVDFYQFTCKKWIANNPIPPDQVSWWLGSKLMIWNQSVVRGILE